MVTYILDTAWEPIVLYFQYDISYQLYGVHKWFATKHACTVNLHPLHLNSPTPPKIYFKNRLEAEATVRTPRIQRMLLLAIMMIFVFAEIQRFMAVMSNLKT